MERIKTVFGRVNRSLALVLVLGVLATLAMLGPGTTPEPLDPPKAGFPPVVSCHTKYANGHGSGRARGLTFALETVVGSDACYNRITGLWTIRPKWQRNTYWVTNHRTIRCGWFPSNLSRVTWTSYFFDQTGRNVRKRMSVPCRESGHGTKLVYYSKRHMPYFKPQAGPVKVREIVELDWNRWGDGHASYGLRLRK